MSAQNHDEKSPFLGAFLASVVPTSGHLYAQNWGRSIKCVAGEIGGAALLMYYLSDQEKRSDRGVHLGIGIAMLTISKIWEMVDAYGATKDYNMWYFDPQKERIDKKINSDSRQYGYVGYKNPNLAFFASLIIPTSGQAYAENWGNEELIILGSEVVGAALIIGGLASHDVGGAIGGVVLGTLIFVPAKIWDVWDAHNSVTEYNHKFYGRYRKGITNPSLGIYFPNQHSLGVQLSAHF